MLNTIKKSLILASFVFLAACQSVPKDVENMPDGLEVTLQGEAVDAIQVQKPWIGMIHASKAVRVRLVNTTSKPLGVTFAADWTDALGTPTESNNSKSVRVIKAGSRSTIIIPANDGRSENAEISVGLKDLERTTLTLNEDDYKEMMTAVISDFRMQFGRDKATARSDRRKIAIDYIKNNTDDSTVSVKNLIVFANKSLQNTGEFNVVNKNSDDIAFHLRLVMQGGRTDSSGKSAKYTLILTAQSNSGNEKTSSSTLTFTKD